jgi:hypothetical protein
MMTLPAREKPGTPGFLFQLRLLQKLWMRLQASSSAAFDVA